MCHRDYCAGFPLPQRDGQSLRHVRRLADAQNQACRGTAESVALCFTHPAPSFRQYIFLQAFSTIHFQFQRGLSQNEAYLIALLFELADGASFEGSVVGENPKFISLEHTKQSGLAPIFGTKS
jgi:hypothetical protein